MITDDHSEVDFILAVIVGAMGTILAVTGWLLKNKFQLYDKHLEASHGDTLMLERVHIEAGHHEQRIDEIQADLKSNTAETRWLGDCMVTLAVKLNTKIPPRLKL